MGQVDRRGGPHRGPPLRRRVLVPAADGGLFLKGGAGIAVYSVDAGPLGEEEDSGLGLHGGVGYDIRVGRNLSLTPAAGVFWGDFGGGDANVLHLGVSITGH